MDQLFLNKDPYTLYFIDYQKWIILLAIINQSKTEQEFIIKLKI